MDKEHWLSIIDDIGPGFAAGAAERDSGDEFVAAHYPVLRERGLLSALIPRDLGGGGASYSTMAAILRRLAYYDGPTALALAMHQHLVAAQVFNHLNGRPAPVLRRVVDDQLVLVSTGANDWFESNGQVTAVDGGFEVSARKPFASGSPEGGIVITSAPYDDPVDGPSVLHFGVPMSASGLHLDDDWQVHGMRATGSRAIVMERVFVPEATVSLKRPRNGFPGVFNVVVLVAMPFITGVYVGIAERAVELGTDLARGRATDPTVQSAVGEMVSAVTVAGVLHDRAVALNNDFQFTPDIQLTDQVFILKAAAVQEARRAVEAAMEASGGAGFYRKNGLELLLRDVRAGDYHPLPSRRQLQFTGRLALGQETTA